MTSDDLLLYYTSVVRPVLEYACLVWQSGLTADQRDRLESEGPLLESGDG
jgi:hypothetical protein